MTERKSYNLGDLVSQCDPDAPIPDTLREWERMVPIGLELVITRHSVDVVHQSIRILESRELVELNFCTKNPLKIPNSS